MIKVYEFADNHTSDQSAKWSLSLSYDERTKARFKATLDQGEVVGIQLPRGRTLRGGDCLKTEAGELIKIITKTEAVSTVTVSDELLFAKICYHLGNRHVPLEIADGYCQYQQDHVLDDMVLGLGGQVSHRLAAFEPENGAYHSGHSAGHHHHNHYHEPHSHGSGSDEHDDASGHTSNSSDQSTGQKV